MKNHEEKPEEIEDEKIKKEKKPDVVIQGDPIPTDPTKPKPKG